nr:hypothetical protein [Nonomuraea terrae]
MALVRRSADVSVADQVSTVGEAGAAAVIIHHDRPGFLITQVASPIPAFTVEQAVGLELLARVGSRLEITGIPDSPYVYDLFPYYAGRVPAKIERRVEHRDLARTTAHYYGGTGRGAEVNFPHRPYDSYIIRQAQEVAIPSTRTEWTTAGDGVVWRPFTWRTAGQDGGLLGSPRSYRAGQKRTEEWFAPVMRPGVPEVLEDDDAQWGLPGFREGDAFTIMVRNMLDGGDHFSEREGEARARLYRDGEQVAERDALEGTWPAAAEPARYRLELDVQHSEPWWEQAARTRTVWGFDSRRPAEGKRELLDLLQIDYDVPAGLDGAVPARKPTRLGLRIYPQTHPNALVNAAVKVWTSHDEGASWQQARKVKQAKDGSLDVTVTHPKGAKSVSLRVEAVARDGVSIDQTVIRAFGLS